MEQECKFNLAKQILTFKNGNPHFAVIFIFSDESTVFEVYLKLISFNFQFKIRKP
jgi:hypothetical protein